MTQPTLSPESLAILHQKAETVCPTCCGAKDVPWYNQQGDAVATKPCPDCNATGNDTYSTGWKYSVLNVRCKYGCGQDGRKVFGCSNCQGSGYVLPPEAELTGVLMELLLHQAKEITFFFWNEWDNKYQICVGDTIYGEGPTLNDALTAAWEKL